MPSTERLHEFVAVVDRGSISGAARALEMPRATLSRRITALETELGLRLLHRGTRRLVLTPAGEELHRRARRIVADAQAAWDSVRRLDDVPRGLLRVSLVDIPRQPVFTEFLRRYPEVRLEVTTTTRHVDLIAEGIDVALRFGPVSDASLIARRLWTGRAHAVASPSYLAAHGRPDSLEQLAEHECFVGFAGAWAPQRTWPLLDGGVVPVSGRVASNSVRLLADAARAGLGIAMLPDQVIGAALDDGSLEIVLEELVGADVPISLVYADREFLDPKVRAFVDLAAPLLGPGAFATR